MGKVARKELQGYLEALALVAGLKVAKDAQDSGLSLDYLAPNGWLVVEQRSNRAMFHPIRLRGPEIIQNLHYAKRVIEYCQDENSVPIGLKPASMFDAQVLAAVRRVLDHLSPQNSHFEPYVTMGEDLRLLRRWAGQ